MTIAHRRLIFALLLLIFFTLGPGLVFYAAGYRFNTKQRRIERVGLLHVTTDPDDSQMILDGKTYEIGKEIVLKSLQPKTYDLILSKDGYHSWIKKIEILPGQSTILREIRLFQNTSPTLTTSQPSGEFVFADEDSLVSQQEDQLTILSVDTQSRQTITLSATTAVRDLQFNQARTLIIFSQNSQWFAADLVTGLITSASGQNQPQQLEFAGDLILALSDKDISVFDLASGELEEQLFIFSLPQHVFVRDEGYWIISTEPAKQRSFLYETSSLSDRPRLVATIPYADDYELVHQKNGLLTLLDTSAKKAVLVDTKILPAKVEVLEGVHSAVWNPAGTELLTATDFEITIQHFNQGRTQELILRLSSPLRDVTWHPDLQHVIYATDDAVFLVERDGSSQRNIFTLAKELTKPHLVKALDNELIFVDTPPAGMQIWQLAL